MPVTLAHWNARKRQRERTHLWPTRQVFLNDLLIFGLGAAGVFSIGLVGTLPGSELLILPLLPVLLIRHGRRAFRREYFWFYIFLAGWLFGTIAGDMYLNMPLANRFKGIARVVFFAMDFMTLAILIDRKIRGMIVFTLSIILFMFFSAWQFHEGFLTAWKFGGSVGMSIVLLLIASYFYARHRYTACILIYLGLAALNLIFAFRSQIAADLVSAALILPFFTGKSRSHNRTKQKGTELVRITILLALAGGAAFAANQAVKYGATHGLFDEGTQEKFEEQSGGKLGVLFGGRPETLVAIQAIRDSPIIGHGSYADEPKYIQLLHDIQYKYGYSDTESGSEEEKGIPTHSHLTMAWVESGILGGICWIYILVVVVRAILRLVALRPPLAPLYCFLLITFVWDIFYSPMGSVNRIFGAFYVLMSYNLLAERDPETAATRPPNARFPLRKRHVRLLRSAS